MAGMDRFQWWISICCRPDCIAGHSQHPYLHCHQHLNLGFAGYARIQEKLGYWCCPGDDHWPRLHHSWSRLVLSLLACNTNTHVSS